MVRSSQVIAFLVFLALSFAAAFFGSQFRPGEWYESLVKPSWNPPSWIFAPVWTALYFLIAIAGFWLWRHRDRPGARTALMSWVVQLVLNALWSWIFFGEHRIGLAFAEITLLLAAILVTVVLAWRVRRAAGALLLPYLAWVAFAWSLNLTLWRLND